MNLSIGTVILVLLSLYLHTNAHHVHKHSGAFKRRRHFQKDPVEISSDKKVSEKLTNSHKEIPMHKIHRKMNFPKVKNEAFHKKTVNSHEIIRKNEIKVMNSTKIHSQIKEPSIVSAKNDKNITNNEYELGNKKEFLNEPKKIIKELIFVRGVYDIRKLLEDFALDVSGEQISQKENHNLYRIDIPEESKKNNKKFRKELEKGNLYQESKELLHEENLQNRNYNQHNLREKEISGEEISSKRFISKENGRIGEERKHLGEEFDEDYIYANSKPDIIKKYIIMKDNKPYSREVEITKYTGNRDIAKSVASKRIENHIINKNNISSSRKKIIENDEDESDPTEGINRKNDISESNSNKKEQFKVIKNYDQLARKELEEKLISEDLNKYENSKESIEIEEHIHTKNMNSEPESIEKFIHIENNYPLHRNYFAGEKLISENSGRKQDIHVYPNNQEEEITKDYIIVRNKNSPSQRRLEESEEIIDSSLKRKSEKTC